MPFGSPIDMPMVMLIFIRIFGKVNQIRSDVYWYNRKYGRACQNGKGAKQYPFLYSKCFGTGAQNRSEFGTRRRMFDSGGYSRRFVHCDRSA